jgi:hypothetical protein
MLGGDVEACDVASMQPQAGLKGHVVPCCLPSPLHHRGEGMKSCPGRGQRRCRRRPACERSRCRRRVESTAESQRASGTVNVGPSFLAPRSRWGDTNASLTSPVLGSAREEGDGARGRTLRCVKPILTSHIYGEWSGRPLSN